MKIKRLPINPHKSDFINFTGGLDITSPQITIPTGFCRRAQNFEEDVLGGYATITGYERFNGSEKTPSSSAFYYLNYNLSINWMQHVEYESYLYHKQNVDYHAYLYKERNLLLDKNEFNFTMTIKKYNR